MDKKPFIIGISGATGSGKSWFANKLKDLTKEQVCIFTLDSYYKDNNYVSELIYRHDNPDAINFEIAIDELKSIIDGKSIKIPQYDYETHQVIGYEVMDSAPIIIIEGLFAFSSKRLVDLMDFRIWIEADVELRLKRRVNRDIKERGDTYNSAVERFYNDAEPAYKAFVSQNMRHADCILKNNDNRSILKFVQLIESLS